MLIGTGLVLLGALMTGCAGLLAQDAARDFRHFMEAGAVHQGKLVIETTGTPHLSGLFGGRRFDLFFLSDATDPFATPSRRAPYRFADLRPEPDAPRWASGYYLVAEMATKSPFVFRMAPSGWVERTLERPLHPSENTRVGVLWLDRTHTLATSDEELSRLWAQHPSVSQALWDLLPITFLFLDESKVRVHLPVSPDFYLKLDPFRLHRNLENLWVLAQAAEALDP